MNRPRLTRLLGAGAAALGLAAMTLTAHTQSAPPARFALEETSIAQIDAALRNGSLTCRSLVEQYLRRIDAYDKNGPALNAIVMVNSAVGHA